MRNKAFLNQLQVKELSAVYTCPITADKYPIINKERRSGGLIYTLRGTEIYQFKDRLIRALPGSVLFIPKGEGYTVTLEGEQSVVIVADFYYEGGYNPPFAVDLSQDDTVKSLFKDMGMKWEMKSSYCVPDCKSCFYRIVALMSRQISKLSSDEVNAKAKRARRALREGFMRADFSIDGLAEEMGISRRYLETLFSRCYGTTPKAYLLSLKMERAKELLLSERLMLKDIALMLGYSDCYHFSKIFKAKTGYTPGQYRRSRGM